MSGATMVPAASPAGGRWRIAVNAGAFQVGWFACVLGAAAGNAALGIAVAGAAVAFHVLAATRRGREGCLVVVALAVGFAIDSVLALAGWVRFASPWPWPQLAPAWILAIWALFATTLSSSLGWLQPRPGLAALLGAVGAPLAYAGAARLGACEVVQPPATYAWLAATWAIVLPALLRVARGAPGPKS